jgi:hypothetical protein
VRRTALDCINAVCVQGMVFCNVTASFLHYCSDDIQAMFISSDGIQEVVKKLQHPHEHVRRTAFDCIKILCDQGMTFSNTTTLFLSFYHF